MDLNFVASIEERDIDLLVLEELQVSPDFCRWLSGLSLPAEAFKQALGAWHSVTEAALGESDLVFIFESSKGQRCALLIENKIDAPQQHRQAERYGERGQQGKTQGKWDLFTTVLIAPERYLKPHSQECYDVQISYEQIRDWLAAQQSTRGAYRAKVINEAIEQNRRGYQAIICEQMTSFWEDYWRIAQERHVDLNVEPPRPRPAKSTWIPFKPKGLPSGLSLLHQLEQGRVRLLIAGYGEKTEELKRDLSSILPEGVTVSRAAKSAAVSCDVPTINPQTQRAEDCREEIIEALGCGTLLTELVRDNIAYFEG